MLTAEAKGIPLIHEMARLAGNRKYFLARKKAKLYMRDVFEVSVDSITTEGSQKLYLDGSDAELMKGKRILLVDDVISTGESMAPWRSWWKRQGAPFAAVWRYWRKAILRNAGISPIWSLFLCFIPTERPGRNFPQIPQRGGDRPKTRIFVTEQQNKLHKKEHLS